MATTTPPPPQSTYVEREPRRSRVTAIAAWVGIVAGVVFIVAVVFFSGFVLGAHSGGGHRHHGGGDRNFGMTGRGGHPPMFPGQMGPRGGFGPGGPESGPGGPGFGPGGPGAQSPEQPQPPTTTAPARP